MKAVVIGATGATGKDLIEVLVKEASVSEIVVLLRRKVEFKHPKIKSYVINFNQPDEWKDLVVGDVAFSCLGTTLKDAGSKDAQWKIDYDYQYWFAQKAKENNVKTFVLVSSGFSNANSPFFYMKMKGQLEDDVVKLGFERTIIFNPPLLIRKNTDRAGENISVKVINFFNSIGIAKSIKPLSTEDLAKSMWESLKQFPNGAHYVKGQEILKL